MWLYFGRKYTFSFVTTFVKCNFKAFSNTSNTSKKIYEFYFIYYL